jgi:hypothetical protein
MPGEVSPDIVVREEIRQPAEPEQGWFGIGRGEEE